MLVIKSNNKIVYCSKHHWELNVMERLWSDQKAYIRSRIDRSFDKMKKLIAESCIHLVEREIALKLVPHCWCSIKVSSQGQAYTDVLKLFFRQLCKTAIQSHHVTK